VKSRLHYEESISRVAAILVYRWPVAESNEKRWNLVASRPVDGGAFVQNRLIPAKKFSAAAKQYPAAGV
jgi:hypothetical protein